ncbi:MAG: dTMP kinase [Streptosporangiaceae bacterium]
MSLSSPFGRRRGGVLAIRPFRRLWIATSLSSLGDWLSLLALTTLAYALTGKHSAAAGGLAVGGVWITSLLPSLLLGPLAGALADRLDRRMTMVFFDVVRALLYLSIPLNLVVGFANQLTWMYIAQFLASCGSLFWAPAKDASVPNLVAPEQLEQANQLSLMTTYGTAPVAALLFTVLAAISAGLARLVPYFGNPISGRVSLALYLDAATFVVSAVTVYSLREIARRQASESISAPSVARAIWEGWRFAGRSRVVRGITVGMVGAFAAGGVVVGIGYGYIYTTLGGGPAGWGVVFAAIFIGLAAGMAFGLRLLGGFSRRRLFGLSIAIAAVPLALIALIPNLIVVAILVVVLGACAGIAYVTGYTIIGSEVDDETRGRTFAFLQSAIKVVMFAVIAVAPVLAAGFSAAIGAAIGSGSGAVHVGAISYGSVGYNIVVLLGAVVAMVLGLISYRLMDDRPGVPLVPDLLGALRGRPLPGPESAAGPAGGSQHQRRGLLFAFEGGEGAGKSTQARLLAIWLRENGYDVLATHEPGATKVGMRLRALLLDTAHTGLSPWAEVLMYAADRAEHVTAVIRPALARGTIVVTDRYLDSSLAYQGAGRELPLEQIREVNERATGGLVPDLTFLLDLPPAAGLNRRARSADRLEAEPQEFHDRVRAGFLRLAAADPDRYLVLDAARDPGEISRQIQAAVRELLPDPVPEQAEEITGTMPVIRE